MRIQVLVLALVMAVLPVQALACSCVAHSDKLEDEVQASMDRARVVVLATAAQVEDFSRDWRNVSEVIRQHVVWNVERAWKGPYEAGDTFNSETATECCVCGMQVQEGKRYLLYLHGSSPFSVSICSMSALADSAADQMRVLDELSAAHNVTEAEPSDSAQ